MVYDSNTAKISVVVNGTEYNSFDIEVMTVRLENEISSLQTQLKEKEVLLERNKNILKAIDMIAWNPIVDEKV